MTNPEPNADELYSDKVVNQKRNILMDLLQGVLDSPREHSSVELWKPHIDAALDRLDKTIYEPFIKTYCKQRERQAQLDLLDRLEANRVKEPVVIGQNALPLAVITLSTLNNERHRLTNQDKEGGRE